MASIHRINAIIAYVNGLVSNYTSADDGQVQKFSKTNVAQTEAELYSWPSFRSFMESIGTSLSPAVSVSHIKDITWSVDMEDETGRFVVSGFEAKGGSGANSNTSYDSSKFPSFGDDIDDKLEEDEGPTSAATATATMRPVFTVTTVGRGSGGYNDGSNLTLSVVGGTFETVATLNVDGLSTVADQDESDYGGGELNGTFVPGTGYNITDTITLSDGSVVGVDTVGTAGDVTAFFIVTASTSGHANWATLAQSSTSGGGSGFSLTQDDDNQGIFSVALSGAIGDYTVIPSNPVATTPNSGGGTGATFNLDWGVLAVTVVDGGEGYASAPDVNFVDAGAGEEASATTTLTGDAVTSVTVSAPGGGYVARAIVTIDAP